MTELDAINKLDAVVRKIHFVCEGLCAMEENAYYVMADIVDQMDEIHPLVHKMFDGWRISQGHSPVAHIFPAPGAGEGMTVAALSKLLSRRDSNEIVKIDGFDISHIDNVPPEGDLPGYLDLTGR